MKSHNDDDNNSDNGAAVRKALEKRKCDLPLLPNTHTHREIKKANIVIQKNACRIYTAAFNEAIVKTFNLLIF